MTPYSTIATVLLVAAIVAIVKLAIKVINLHDELTHTEQDADAYKDEYVQIKDTYADLLIALATPLQRYEICCIGTTLFVNRLFRLGNKDFKVAVKQFNATDDEDLDHAKLEAEDLLDALNGKIGWRINELGNP